LPITKKQCSDAQIVIRLLRESGNHRVIFLTSFLVRFDSLLTPQVNDAQAGPLQQFEPPGQGRQRR
jgi:hypothetical protein